MLSLDAFEQQLNGTAESLPDVFEEWYTAVETLAEQATSDPDGVDPAVFKQQVEALRPTVARVSRPAIRELPYRPEAVRHFLAHEARYNVRLLCMSSAPTRAHCPAQCDRLWLRTARDYVDLEPDFRSNAGSSSLPPCPLKQLGPEAARRYRRLHRRGAGHDVR